MTTATFGAGCFWQVEAAFRNVEGVLSTRVGYAGGSVADPSYEDVCTGRTGHAEVCEVTYDESALSYEELLDVFWAVHDPTTLNRQGWDVGSQYRSAILYHDVKQKEVAEASKEKLQAQGRFKKDIVTEIAAASNFYTAEDYHQQYLQKRGLATCKIPG